MKRFLSGFKTMLSCGSSVPILFIIPAIVLTCAIFPHADFSPYDAYLPVIAIVSSCSIFYSSGAWDNMSDYKNEAPSTEALIPAVGTSVGALVAVIIVIACGDYGFSFIAPLSRLAWYIFDISMTIFAIVFIIKAINHADRKWLDGNNGKIGIANYISTIRIAISILIPHIILTEWLGAHSRTIASIILTLAIITDKLDGTIARKTGCITRAGMVLDPIGDKALFYPVAIACTIILYGETERTDFAGLHSIGIIVAAITIPMRDAIVLAWFVLLGRKSHKDIGATTIDKVRMVALCVWMISTVFSLADLPFSSALRNISALSLYASALLSIYSVFSDFKTLNLKEKIH